MDPCANFTEFENLTMFLQEDEDLNSTVEEFHQNEIAFSTGEKICTFLEWISIITLGTGFNFLAIQYEKFGEDPLKRRLVDQVLCNYESVSEHGFMI